MNKGLVMLVMLLSMIGIATAGSLDIGFDDCTRQHEDCVRQECTYWHHSPYKHCHNWECVEWETVCEESIDNTISYTGDIDADTLSGNTIDDITAGIDNTYVSIMDNDERWSTDGRGMDRGNLGRYLVGDMDFFYTYSGTFVDWLKGIFALKTDVDSVNERMDIVEARARLGNTATEHEVMLKSMMVRAERTGFTQEYNGYLCYPVTCIRAR